MAEPNSKHESDDPLLRRAREAKAKAEKSAADARKEPQGFIGSLTSTFTNAVKGTFDKINEIHTAARRFNKMYDATCDVASTVKTYGAPFAVPFVWAGNKMKNYFNWAAYKREGEGLAFKWKVLPYYDKGTQKMDSDGDPIFSKVRLGKALGTTATIALAAVVGLQAAYFFGTKFEETVYVTGKQEVSQGEKYQFSGCTTKPCSTDSENGKYYTIDSSMYLPALWFPDQDVYSNIGTVGDVCHVKGYGVYERHFRILHKSLNFWQNVYNVSCEQQNSLQPPVTGPTSQNQIAAPAAVMPG